MAALFDRSATHPSNVDRDVRARAKFPCPLSAQDRQSVGYVHSQPLALMSRMDVKRRHGVVTAEGAWFLRGPVAGRLMAVEVTVYGSLPEAVRLPQTGQYVGSADLLAPAVDHVYVLTDRLDDMGIYRYERTEAGQSRVDV